jgi:hypothetical protein
MRPIPPWRTRPAARDLPACARAYATRTDKTLARDVNWLEAQGLVRATPAGYEVNRERMLAFLPWRRQSAPGRFETFLSRG